MTMRDDTMRDVTACRYELDRIADALKWTLEPGLNGRAEPVRLLDLDAPLAPLTRAPVDDPDFVPGARWSLEVGDPRMRSAFVRATHWLAVAEVRVATAVMMMGTRGKQPPLVRPDRFMTFGIIDVARISMSHRLDLLRFDVPKLHANRLELVAHHITGPVRSHEPPHALKSLELATRRLSMVVVIGSAGDDDLGDRCANCMVRPRVERGKRCATCKKYWSRHKTERPASLDGEIVQAKAAQARRRARGEHWGIG